MYLKEVLDVLKEIPTSDRKGLSHLTIAKELKRLDIEKPRLNDVKHAIDNVLGRSSAFRLNKTRITGISSKKTPSPPKQTSKYIKLNSSNNTDSKKTSAKKTLAQRFRSLFTSKTKKNKN
jgi:hypothetical protein